MGTRGFTGITVDGTRRFAYQQFDSYPSGVGADVLVFARQLTDPGRLEPFVAAARRLVPVEESAEPTTEQRKLMELRQWEFADERVSTGRDWYSWLRKTQGQPELILRAGFIAERPDATNGESNWDIEWSYELDLTRRLLIGYIGCPAEDQPTEPGSFSGSHAWSFDALPFQAEFVATLDALNE